MPLDANAPLFPEPSATARAIDAAIAAQIAAQPPRAHLGMSQIGKADTRTLWLQFRGCLPQEHEPRAERIFRLGDAIEDELARYTRLIPGATLHTEDAAGRQFRFELFGGHFAGSMDGAVIGVPEAPTVWHVWEAKSVSAKRFAKLEREGVKTWSPEYYAQLQCYMGVSGMTRALFMAYCKDNSSIYTERVRFDATEWAALQTKALRIIEAPEPPVSSFRDRTWYEAKWMPVKTSAIYWRDQLPPVAHCKTCRNSTPVLDQPGQQWHCSRWQSTIPRDTLKTGCAEHQWIPALIPAQIQETTQ